MRTARLLTFGIGAALLAAGIANALFPLQAFPAVETCRAVGDGVSCHVVPWSLGAVAAFAGVTLIALATLSPWLAAGLGLTRPRRRSEDD